MRREIMRPRRPDESLKALADAAAVRLADASTEEVLDWVAYVFGYRAAVASSMGDATLSHVVSQHLPWVDVLFGDTGYHFAETIGTRDAVAATMKVTVVDVVPRRTVAEQDAALGKDLFATDPSRCCRLRKVQPMADALADYEVWLTGIRRDESPSRADAPLISWDEKNGLVKVNPLVNWTEDEIAAYQLEHGIIVNPLVADGYPSIGCAPCTRRVAPGEDARAGRWAGFDKTECGLHA